MYCFQQIHYLGNISGSYHFVVIQIFEMPKKNQKKQQKKPELQIVDQQKEPCLRALQKKVRNINKKLSQIADLESKKDLKPEQLDKIQRKDTLLEEKQKYLEFITIYSEITQENAKAIRNVHLNQLKEIATILAAREYGAHLQLPVFPEVESLVKILAAPSVSDLTLVQRVDQITNKLFQVAENAGMKKTYLKFVEENSDKLLPAQNFSNQPEPRSNKSEEQREEVIHDIDEELHQVDQETGEPHILVEPHVMEAEDHQNQQKVEIPSSKPDQAEPKPQEIIQNKIETEKQDGEQGQQKKRRQYKRGGGDQDGRRGRRGNYNKPQDANPERKKKNFKPKYAPKEKEEKNDSDSGSDSSVEVKEFKREERKKLEDEGFIFIGGKNPKPKARDQKNWHEHQHGRKHPKKQELKN